MVTCTLRILLAVILGAMVSGTGSKAQPPASAVAYRFTYAEPGSDSVAIELAWAPALREPAALVMPRAIPMGYGEQRYDAYVSDVRASGATAQANAALRDEGPRWRLPAGTERVG